MRDLSVDLIETNTDSMDTSRRDLSVDSIESTNTKLLSIAEILALSGSVPPFVENQNPFVNRTRKIIELQSLEFIKAKQEQISAWLLSEKFTQIYCFENPDSIESENDEILRRAENDKNSAENGKTSENKIENSEKTKNSADSIESKNDEILRFAQNDKETDSIESKIESTIESKIESIIESAKAIAQKIKATKKLIPQAFSPMLDPQSIDYESTSAAFAFALNLPLPPYYDFIRIESHGVGNTGITRFLALCGVCQIVPNGVMQEARQMYENYYNALLAIKRIKNGNTKKFTPAPPKPEESEIFLKDCELPLGAVGENRAANFTHICLALRDMPYDSENEKLFALIPAKKCIILCRDPISMLRHYITCFRTMPDLSHELSFSRDPHDFVRYYVGYEIDADRNLGFFPKPACIPLWINNLFTTFHDGLMARWAFRRGEVGVLEMRQIVGSATFKTMGEIAKWVGFNPPKEEDKEHFSKRTSDYQCITPIHVNCNKFEPFFFEPNAKFQAPQMQEFNNLNDFYFALRAASKFPLENFSAKITIEHEFYKPRECVDLSEFFPNAPRGIIVFCDEKSALALQNDADLWKKTQTYVNIVLGELLSTHEIEMAKILKDSCVIEYFRENKKEAEFFARILEQHLSAIKVFAPYLLEQWESYKSFVLLCKELNIKAPFE